ncbi:MAG: PIN domain-containing protein [Bacteroidetes bacterium]|nr:PIN domain-containing protein [Bacteroidota bacterium]
MKNRLFFDTDVILDIALDRKPFSEFGATLLSQVESNHFSGFTSSVIFSNVYYIHRKLASHAAAISFLRKLRLILTVLPVDDMVIQTALESDLKDFEDSIQYYAALKNKMDFIITRNVNDFKGSQIPVHTPEEFLLLKL